MPTLEQIRRIWQRLPGSQRLFIGVVLVALIGIIVFVGSWASREEYGVLYANLAPEDASSIVDRLNGQGVAYKLTHGGQTIMVPRPQVYELRLSLASAGLPQASGPGYELLDANKMGWTDFVQKLQFRRALEGEIARTIQTLDAVQQARVHIVMPEPSLFAEEEPPPTASVVIKVRPGGGLPADEVQGIVHLVAAGVEGLQPEQVTVLDTRGQLLSRRQGAQDLLGATSDQLELTHTIEEGLARKAQSALEEVLGPNRAVVRVSAVLDFERAETTREIFDHQNPVVRSEQRSEQTSGDAGTTESSTTNYEISKTIQRIVDTPGSITRLSASVFVDGTYEPAADGGHTYVPRTPEEMQKLTALIKTAIGFDADRGDELTVENVAFDDTQMQRTLQQMEQNQFVEMIHEYGGVALSALLAVGALLILWRLFSRTRAGLARIGQGSAAELEGGLAGTGLSKPRDPQAVRIERQLRQISGQPPEVVASVVRAWLQEP